MKLPLLVVIACVAVGCSSSHGLHVDSLQEILRREAAQFEQENTQSAARPIAPALPSLGLYVNPTGFLRHGFEWTDQDRTVVLDWAKELVTSKTVAGANFVSQSSLKGNTLVELRTAAARYGADLLLVFDGAAAIDRYNNYKAALLYWTILGAYTADGTHSDALCLVKGTLWDVKSGSMLFQEEAEGRSHTVGPAAFVDDDAMVLQARQQALSRLLEKVKSRLASPRIP